MDQRGLVERAQRGDHDAFAVLAGADIARLDAAARLILRDPELARDAVQEAMVRAWRGLPTLRDVERYDAWVHRLLVNACLDLLRRRKRRAFEVEMTPLHAPSVADFSGGVAERDLLDRRSGPSRPTGARSSSSTTSWGCRCPRLRPAWGSRLAPQSRASTARSGCCAAPSRARTRRPS